MICYNFFYCCISTQKIHILTLSYHSTLTSKKYRRQFFLEPPLYSNFKSRALRDKYLLFHIKITRIKKINTTLISYRSGNIRYFIICFVQLYNTHFTILINVYNFLALRHIRQYSIFCLLILALLTQL